MFSSGLLIKQGKKNYNPLFLILLIASWVVIVLGQSRWQDVTTFHPYCVRLFRSCVESSSVWGAGSGNYSVTVGICGNKMAICTFSGNLTWPWSSNLGLERPASASVDATPRLTMYRNILSESSATAPWQPMSWRNSTDFLSDCRAEFVRCVDTLGGVLHNLVVGACGHGMSVCTERQGRWPYGNDSSVFCQQAFTNDRVQLYRNVYSGTLASARSWQKLTIFLPLCRSLMAQCVAASGGESSNIAVGHCGNRMGICTFENILWPHTYDASIAYTVLYDARWQRYANVINSISRWQDITRFSSNCIDSFFACVYASTNATYAVIGVCGNYMSICTFSDNIWPNASQGPTTTESYSARLGIYRAMFEHMLPSAPSYFTFPPLTFDLYSFSSHTFTNAGATGRFGPTLSACRSAYSSQAWAQNSSFFSMTTQGIQEWTVAKSGSYKISVKGAAGAGLRSFYGGQGAFIEGTFSLQRSDILCIVVGQMGVLWSGNGGGGGGGSFVYIKSSNTLLIAAGGGGGGGRDWGYGGFGSSTTIPVNGGESGNGGYSGIGYGGNGGGFSLDYLNDAAGGGGGWQGDGGDGSNIGTANCVGYGGKGRPGNFVGGYHVQFGPASGSSVGNGGFGGGGGMGGWGVSGGGGGGYTGGGGGNNWNGTTHGGGQGGGSFNAGADQVNTPDNCNTHGSVTITAL